MPNIVFFGIVFSGTGQGRKFIDLPWVKRQIEDTLGFTPYSGTLNLRLTTESTENKQLFLGENGFVIEPQAGYFKGILFRATINSIHSAIVIPKAPNYPNDVLEVIAPIYLRGCFKLVDGSPLAITVMV